MSYPFSAQGGSGWR